MNFGARTFRVSSQSMMAMIPLVTLLAASGIWNVRQHTIIERLRQRVQVAEQAESARAKAEAERAEARRKRQAEWAASDARVQQLYREIDTLGRINERMAAEPGVPRGKPRDGDGNGEPGGLP